MYIQALHSHHFLANLCLAVLSGRISFTSFPLTNVRPTSLCFLTPSLLISVIFLRQLISAWPTHQTLPIHGCNQTGPSTYVESPCFPQSKALFSSMTIWKTISSPGTGQPMNLAFGMQISSLPPQVCSPGQTAPTELPEETAKSS